jgi:hypothetical protein
MGVGWAVWTITDARQDKLFRESTGILRAIDFAKTIAISSSQLVTHLGPHQLPLKMPVRSPNRFPWLLSLLTNTTHQHKFELRGFTVI